MSSALSIGTTGLTASEKQMDVIGNNLANSNTLGFKAGSTFFASMLNQSLSGGSSGSMQVGQGVSVAEVATQFSQGSFETTGNATDMAIDGEGFFVVRDIYGADYYTRAGAFHIDDSGYLVDVNSYKVQGYNLFSTSGQDEQSDICLKNVQSAPQASTEVNIGANLDDNAAAGEKFNVSQNVFDSKGQLHNLSITFMKTEASGQWSFDIKLDSDNISTDQAHNGLVFDLNGNLDKMYTADISTPTITTAGDGDATATVNRVGQLYKDSSSNIVLTRGANENTWVITDNGGYENVKVDSANDEQLTLDLDSEGGPDITFDLTGTWALSDTISFSINNSLNDPAANCDPADVVMTFGALANGATIGDTTSGTNQMTWNVEGSDAQKLSGYASTSVVKSLKDNGYTSGVLKGLTIDSTGVINGFFTNGQSSKLGQIILANFPNTSGLKKVGNYFGETAGSGEAIKNKPGSGGLGEVMANSLETSNTDVAKEFINMIMAQRAYQASARIITTADQMLSELMNIKR